MYCLGLPHRKALHIELWGKWLRSTRHSLGVCQRGSLGSVETFETRTMKQNLTFYLSHQIRQIYYLYPRIQKLRGGDERVGLSPAMLMVVMETGAQGCNNLYP